MRSVSRSLALSLLLVIAAFGGVLTTAATTHVASAARLSPTQLLGLLGSERSMGVNPGKVAVVSPVAAASAGRRSGACTNAPDAGGWLTTSGMWVVDAATNCKIRLEGVNWYGMQTQYYVPAGLDFASYQSILADIKDLGFNSVRIPLSDAFVRYSNKETVTKYVKKSPELAGMHPLDVLDLIVRQAQDDGLWVILDNHDSAAVTKSQIHSEQKSASPVWTAKNYPQSAWINDWTTLARRYGSGHYCGMYSQAASGCQNTPTVVGFDLHNEPHTSHHSGNFWNMPSYLKYGSVWGPCTVSLCGKTYAKWWSSESATQQAASNWPAAATLAANTVLAVNPHLLMIVEGTQLYPEVTKKSPKGVDSYWWGSILKGVATDPINLSSPQFNQQLVYSPHEWGPWKFDSPQFYSGKSDYNSQYKGSSSEFNSQWGFILHSSTPHPMWLGEFNTCNMVPNRHNMSKLVPRITNVVQCTYDTRKNSQGLWWRILMQFLQKNPEIGWSYYPLNPVNSLDETSNNSLLYPKASYPHNVDQDVMNGLKSLEGAPPQSAAQR